MPPLDSTIDLYKNRAAIAANFLQSRGVEIGAYTQPTDLPPDRDVAFYDRYTADELLGFCEPDCGRPMMMPDYVGDAAKLDGLPDAAFDFVIANHVIEHLQDPIQFLMNVAIKLVSGGHAMIAVRAIAGMRRVSLPSSRISLTTTNSNRTAPARPLRAILYGVRPR